MAAAAVGCGLAGVMRAWLRPPPGVASRVRPYTASGRLGGLASRPSAWSQDGPGNGFVARAFGPPLLALVRAGTALLRTDDAALVRLLRHAGVRDPSPDAYRVQAATRALGYGALGLVVGGVALRTGLVALVLAAAGVAHGAARARARLDRIVEARRERLRLELVTINLLLAIHVRTGAGPLQAVRRVVERGSGLVADELAEVLAGVRAGLSEGEAFRRAAAVTPEPFAARTYRLFATAAEHGADLSDGLRALAEDLRDARREELRRTATKRRAAMLVPTIAVLAPLMLLFVAAPLPSIVFGTR